MKMRAILGIGLILAPFYINFFSDDYDGTKTNSAPMIISMMIGVLLLLSTIKPRQ
jgi:hypothetical protein